MLTQEELNDIQAFLKQHKTLCDKLNAVTSLLTAMEDSRPAAAEVSLLESQQSDLISSLATQRENTQQSDIISSSLATQGGGVEQRGETATERDEETSGHLTATQGETSLATQHQEGVIARASGGASQGQSVSGSEFAQSDSGEDSDDDDDDDDDDNDLALSASLPASQVVTRSTLDTDETCEWNKALHVHVANLAPAYFYIIVFAVHGQDRLVKIGITRSTDKRFRERYSIYYRVYFYLKIDLEQCPDLASFHRYDAAQKAMISGNAAVLKYSKTRADMETLQGNDEALNEFEIHIPESSGEVYHLGPGQLPVFVTALRTVASTQHHREATIPLYKGPRITRLAAQLFDVQHNTCLGTRIYRDGHFSPHHMHSDTRFDFPLSITSVRNICEAFINKIKSNHIKCTWRDGRWELRFLWVGIGLAEESILLVLYFRQLGIFVTIVGLELHADVVRWATESVAKYDLQEHIRIQQMDVLQYKISKVRSKQIDIIYTSAVVEYIFMWRLHLMALASSQVQALIAPTGMMSNLHHIQDGAASFHGASLGFYPVGKRNKIIYNFCEKCQVATGPLHDTQDDDRIQHRPFKILIYSEDMHTRHYVRHVADTGRTYMIENALKHATMAYTDTLRTQIIHSFNTERGHEIITGNSITVGDIKVKINKSEWETYLKHFRHHKHLRYAISNIRKKMKIVMYRDNMFCDIFPTNLTPSRDPSDSTSGYNAYTAEFLNDAFEQEDHTNTRPVKFTEGRRVEQT